MPMGNVSNTNWIEADTIVWLNTSYLGDLILSTLAFNAFKARFPDKKQYLITSHVGKASLESHGSLDKVIVFDKRSRGFLKTAKLVKSQLGGCSPNNTILIQAHRSFRSSFLAKFLGFSTITYQESSLSFLADIRLPRSSVLHESLRIGLLLEPLGIGREALAKERMSLANSDASSHLKDTLKNQKEMIAIAPGSVWGTKRWPAESYGELLKRILSDTDYSVVLLGSPNEKDVCQTVLSVANDSTRVLNLAGHTSLSDLLYIYPKLKLLVANDSSPIHFASAFDIPTIAIFGATVSGMGFGPLAKRSKVVELSQADVPCRPCSDHGPKECPLGHFDCMVKINPARVFEELKKTL
ncbi:MAG: glycosyltransferase family 9 protein [Pseudobacteriovorax sp.]|nr:glycosyltransferase family 9 protein [Pseudobacteriovorax sp.]